VQMGDPGNSQTLASLGSAVVEFGLKLKVESSLGPGNHTTPVVRILERTAPIRSRLDSPTKLEGILARVS
jgi:hypothetical protein